MKKKLYTVAAASITALALLLTACGNSNAASTKTKETTSKAAGKSSSEKTESMILYIGLTDQLKEVPCDCEATPDALIAALAEETGWDLTLAKPVTHDEGTTGLAVAFAGDSAIYTAPPEKQKEDYHVYDAEDYIYTVLSSTAETLKQNLNAEYVAFTSPDDGNLDFENGGYHFYLSSRVDWNEEAVRTNNEPLPEDSIGQTSLDPIGETPLGWHNLTIMFKREGVKPASGKITIYNEDGTVFSQCEVSDTERVAAFDLSETEIETTGRKNSSNYYVYFDEQIEAGKTYYVAVDAGAFATDSMTTKEIPKEDWTFTCADYGMGKSSAPGNTKVKLGEDITQELLLGSDVDHIEIKVEDAEMGTASNEQMTKDGTVTFKPAKTGQFVIIYRFVFKDERKFEMSNSYDIIP